LKILIPKTDQVLIRIHADADKKETGRQVKSTGTPVQKTTIFIVEAFSGQA
jgi:hypothetical protein